MPDEECMTPTMSEQEYSPVTGMSKQPPVNVGLTERWLSGVGEFLLTASLARSDSSLP